MNRVRLVRISLWLVFVLLNLTFLSSSTQVQAQDNSRVFPETGMTVRGKFLEYWNAHGGLAQQGLPLSEELQESRDLSGKMYTVQYFERAVFELHPENSAPDDVLLSLVGVFRYKDKYPHGAQGEKASTENNAFKFNETGHTIGGRFRQYWDNHGGLAQQGFPISDEFLEFSTEDKQPHKVQYFQRAVFELHTENAPPNDVLLTRLGAIRYDSRTSLWVDPKDLPLNIEGWANDDATLTHDVSLMALADPIEEFTFRSSNLRSGTNTGAIEISRQNVKLIGGDSIPNKVPTVFQVQVTGITTPGVYSGTISFLLPGQGIDEEFVIPIIVQAKARPVLAPLAGSDHITLNLTKCGKSSSTWSWFQGIDCIFLPDSNYLDERLLNFENKSLAPVIVTDASLVLNGEETSYPLPGSPLATQEPLSGTPTSTQDQSAENRQRISVKIQKDGQELPANKIVTLPIEITRKDIPPDHYTGNLYLTFQGYEERMVLPVEINMRIGALWPLVALLFGLLFGWIFRYSQSRGAEQETALTSYYYIRQQVEAAEPADRVKVEPLLKGVADRIYLGKLAGIGDLLAAIQSRVDILHDLRRIEVILLGLITTSSDSAIVSDAQGILIKIATAQGYVAGESEAALKSALTLRDKIQTEQIELSMRSTTEPSKQEKVRAAIEESTLGGRTYLFTKKVERTIENARAFGIETAMQEPEKGSWIDRFILRLQKIAGGARKLLTVVTHYFLRPTIFILSLAILTLAGLNTLYIEKGLTFGSNIITDYIGLIAWGFGTNVFSTAILDLFAGKRPDAAATAPSTTGVTR